MTSTVGSASEDRTNLASTRASVKSAGRLRPRQEERLPGARFFLSKPSTNSSGLELGKEFSSEGEARVESLKAGLTYYSLQEWRPVPDFAGRNPELKREQVTRGIASHAQE
jgi:hypothetical protein